MTVIVDDPAGVDAEVVRVNVDEHAGLHDPGETEAVAPVGRPEAESVTDCVVPEIRVAVIVLLTDCPRTTDLFPPLEIEKSNDGGGGGGSGAAAGMVDLGTIPQMGVSSNPLLATVDQLLAPVSLFQASEAPGAPSSAA